MPTFSAFSDVAGALLGEHGASNVYEQQSACVVALYPNESLQNATEKRSQRRILYAEIISCSYDKSVSDIGGSFSITLHPTEPWDESIQPDDFVRIFMGDRSASSNNQTIFKNVKFAFLNELIAPSNKATGNSSLGSFIQVRLANAGKSEELFTNGFSFGSKSTAPSSDVIVMERFIGKVDRVECNEIAPSATSGSQTVYTISGRSLGSIVQDITLYYNQHIQGLNAVDTFFGSGITLDSSPSEYVESVLSLILTMIPLPQWQLPATLVSEYSISIAKNATKISAALTRIQGRVTASAANNNVSKQALFSFNAFLAQASAYLPTSPLSIISLDMKETFGKMFNRNFMSNGTSGAADVIKHISNDFMNEFFFDLCPNGDAEGGRSSTQILTPTFVMRQRPYDINSDVMEAGYLADYISPYADTLALGERLGPTSDFSTPTISSSIQKSLIDISLNGFSIAGATDGKLTVDYGHPIADNFPSPIDSPQVVEKNTGLSGHERHNLFLVIPAISTGSAFGADAIKVAMASTGGIKINTDSIRKFGFRAMEVTTVCNEIGDTKNSGADYLDTVKKFTQFIANWYMLNPVFLNGRISSRFIPDARIGVPCLYFETRITDKNPYQKCEMYYVQSVSESFTVGQVLLTNISVVRGLRYTLAKQSLISGVGRALTNFSQYV